MANYKVRTACEVLGIWREKDAVIEADPRQVRELVAPFGNVLERQEDKGEGNDNGKVSRRERNKRETPDGLGPRPAVDRQDPDDQA